MEKETIQCVFQAHDYEQVDQLIKALFDNSNAIRFGESHQAGLSMPLSSPSDTENIAETQNRLIRPLSLAFA